MICGGQTQETINGGKGNNHHDALEKQKEICTKIFEDIQFILTQ